ncbi:hypothetical protein JHK86_018693 [Glycine max]|nr:hypothetical protein JHK86_018693 [Glycine max]
MPPLFPLLVSILNSTFSWNELDHVVAKRVTHTPADLAKNATSSASFDSAQNKGMLSHLGFSLSR